MGPCSPQRIRNTGGPSTGNTVVPSTWHRQLPITKYVIPLGFYWFWLIRQMPDPSALCRRISPRLVHQSLLDASAAVAGPNAPLTGLCRGTACQSRAVPTTAYGYASGRSSRGRFLADKFKYQRRQGPQTAADLVFMGGIEPPTFRLLGTRSCGPNLAPYGPIAGLHGRPAGATFTP